MSHRIWKRHPLSRMFLSAFGAAGLSLMLAAAPVFAQSTSSSGTSSSDQSLSGQSSTQSSTPSTATGGATSSSDRNSTSGMSSSGASGTTSSGTADTSGTSGTSGTTGTAGTSPSTGTSATTGTTTGSTPGATAGTQTAPSTGSTTGATAADTGATGGGAYVPGDKSTVAASDRNLIRQLARVNLAEIEAAKLAQSKSKNDEVLNFARQMLDDHTKAHDQLEQLAQQKGVQLPTEPDAKHKALTKKLEALSGDAFDREYLAKAGVSDHTQAHKLVTRVKARAKDADLKQLATDLESSFHQHLQMAKEVRSSARTSTGSSGATSGDASSGTSSDQSTDKPRDKPSDKPAGQ